jgi:hypothetical protein
MNERINHTRELLCFAIGDYADKMALKITELIMTGAHRDAEDMAQAFADMVSSAADTLDLMEQKRTARAGTPAALEATAPPAAPPAQKPQQSTPAAEEQPKTPANRIILTEEEFDFALCTASGRRMTFDEIDAILRKIKGTDMTDEEVAELQRQARKDAELDESYDILRRARGADMTDEEADEVLRNARNFGIDRGLLADEIVFPSDGMEEVPPTVQFSSLHSDSPEFSQAGQFRVPLSPVARVFAEQDDETAARPHSKLPRAVGVVRTEDPASEMPPQAPA